MHKRQRTDRVSRPAMASGDVLEYEQALYEREESYRALIYAAPDIIYALSASDGSIIFLNRAFESVTGHSRSAWLGKPFTSLIHPDDSDQATDAFRQLLVGESVPRLELRIVSKTGDYLIAEIGAAPEVEDGKLVRVFGFARDVTDRRQVEDALIRSELEYRNLFENAGDGILIYESETGILLQANNKACEVYGYSKNQLVGMSMNKIVKDLTCFEQGTLETVQTDKRENFETVHFRKDGTEIDLLASMSKIEFGGREAILSIGRQVTERKRADEALRESEERYQGLVDTAFDGVVIHEDGVIKSVNRAYAEMYGYTIEELIGRDVLELTPPEHREFVWKKITEQAEAPYETVGLKKNGTYINIEVSAKTCHYAGRHSRLAAVRDITGARRAETALRASEQRYRLLFERNLSGVSLTTLNGRVVDCNESFARMLGYENREEACAAGVLSLYPRAADREAFLSRLHEQGIVNNFELCLNRKDGSPVWVLMNASLIEDDHGKPILIEGILMDVSERRLAEEGLRGSREQLRALAAHLQVVREEERTRIAREIHDELGQALTRLKIDLSLLGDDPSDDRPRLLQQTKTMSNLLDETIQTVRRISSELRPSALDDLGLTAAIEEQLSQFQDHTNIECRLISGPEYLMLDQGRSTAVFRILQEALTNVARHANATRVEARLTQESGYVKLIVCDNGRGIPPDQVYNRRSLGLVGMRERALLFGGTVNLTAPTGAAPALPCLSR